MTSPERYYPEHHPSEAYLLDYASGAAAEPVALLVASHLTFCPLCREEIRLLEDLGGTLLDAMPPATVSAGSLERLIGRLEQADQAGAAACPVIRETGDPTLPAPLRRYVEGRLEDLVWRRIGSIAEARLLPDYAKLTTRLLNIRAGAGVPAHTHEGNELTLVLRGSYTDGTGRYRPGDVAEADGEIDHRPVADPDEDCLCFAVTDAPLKLTSRIGRLLNPFVRL
jgi:putative transcriptional regulator